MEPWEKKQTYNARYYQKRKRLLKEAANTNEEWAKDHPIHLPLDDQLNPMRETKERPHRYNLGIECQNCALLTARLQDIKKRLMTQSAIIANICDMNDSNNLNVKEEKTSLTLKGKDFLETKDIQILTGSQYLPYIIRKIQLNELRKIQVSQLLAKSILRMFGIPFYVEYPSSYWILICSFCDFLI